MELLDFPDEILLEILKRLTLKEALQQKIICRRFHSIERLESLWKFFCRRDFNVGDKELAEGWTFREFYSKVLYRYRFMIGWWTRDLVDYGGLIRVKVEKGSLVAYECLPPMDDIFKHCDDIKEFIRSPEPLPDYQGSSQDLKGVQRKEYDELLELPPNDEGNRIRILPWADYSIASRKHMRFHKIFALKNCGKHLLVYCYQSHIGLQDDIAHNVCPESMAVSNHVCTPADTKTNAEHDYDRTSCGSTNFVEKTDDGFKFQCKNCAIHKASLNFNYWFELEHGFHVNSREMLEKTLVALFYEDHYYIRNKKFEVLANTCGMYDLSRLTFRPEFPDKLHLPGPNSRKEHEIPTPNILPGVYFGSYSVHGWEMLMIDYHWDEERDCWVLQGKKITGDNNVPAGQISFDAFLNQGLIQGPNRAQSCGDVNECMQLAKTRKFELTADEAKRFTNQECSPPPDCDVRLRNHVTPQRCQGLFIGDGQVAGPNFHQPGRIPLIYMPFEAGFFGIFWVELACIALFYRSDAQPE